MKLKNVCKEMINFRSLGILNEKECGYMRKRWAVNN